MFVVIVVVCVVFSGVCGESEDCLSFFSFSGLLVIAIKIRLSRVMGFTGRT